MSRASNVITPMTSVYDGRKAIGFIFARGKLGHEAFDREQRSLGLFKTASEAANAVSRAASNEEGAG